VRSKVLGALADKVLNTNATGGEVAGVESEDQNWQAIGKWYSVLPPQFQQKIFEILNSLAMINDAKQFEIKTTQIVNLLSTLTKMRNGSNN
jgi:hypothetical protein